MLSKDQALLFSQIKPKSDSMQEKILNEYNAIVQRMKTDTKRKVFRKMTWEQMYLKICEDDPRKLAVIIHVQKRWR